MVDPCGCGEALKNAAEVEPVRSHEDFESLRGTVLSIIMRERDSAQAELACVTKAVHQQLAKYQVEFEHRQRAHNERIRALFDSAAATPATDGEQNDSGSSSLPPTISNKSSPAARSTNNCPPRPRSSSFGDRDRVSRNYDARLRRSGTAGDMILSKNFPVE